MSGEDDLDVLVRRADPDRWLASRFVADPSARSGLIALYAYNNELARAAEVASQPLIGEMRLVWWREAVQEVYAGGPVRSHPVAQALAAAQAGLSQPLLQGLAEARLRDLEGWPLRPDEVEDYVELTAGRLMAAAVQLLAPGTDPHVVRYAAQAWGLSGLSTVRRLPADWTAEEVRGRVEAALARARVDLAGLPVAAFPAVAYVALGRSYVSGRTPSEFGKRARVTLAVLRGRL